MSSAPSFNCRRTALHDALLDGGYPADQLDQFLTRVLFCLFAEDTQIFEANQFTSFILNHTREDGSDLGVQLAQLFAILNTPDPKRQKTLAEHLLAFPYVNGRLFADQLPFAGTDRKMRETLMATTELDWSRISPAIFGSMFQGVMESKERRQVGAHYTGEPDILKVINPLFMDALRAEFAAILILKDKKERLRRLRAFHDKIASLNFLDPACGCGNFLIIAYRELRALETEVIKHELELSGHAGQTITDIEILTRVRVSQFHGIEIGHFPSEIARVAMWLMDHQANMHLSKELGRYFLRLPLSDAANIVTGNALQIPWKTVIAPGKCSYILGNPPFVGKKARDHEQQTDMARVWGDIKGSGVLDYVTCWYRLAAHYIGTSQIGAAFVSTSSISQGEQVSILWDCLLNRHQMKIHFAHRTFPWVSEARGKACVHVVIVGFGFGNVSPRRIFDYDNDAQNPTISEVSNISPFLIAGGNETPANRKKPICTVPEMQFGSMPNDGGHFLFTAEEKTEFLKLEPQAEPLFRSFLSAHEYLHGQDRFCLWLLDANPKLLRSCPLVMERIEAVKTLRASSNREATKKLAKTPSLFGEVRAPKSRFVLVPCHSSENRDYIPFSYFEPNLIPGNSCLFMENATLYDFGIIASAIHMAWVKQVCGRLESRYRYSASLVYNNFPWPKPTGPQRTAVEKAAQAVIDAREQFPDSTLADLYDPISMPPALAKAHDALDRAVDRCYKPQGFQSDRERVEHLFKLYEQLVAPLAVAAKPKKPRKKP